MAACDYHHINISRKEGLGAMIEMGGGMNNKAGSSNDVTIKTWEQCSVTT
jgi:hypothetical protein